MYDGVKILVHEFDYDMVVRSPLLDFTQKRDVETNEAILNEYGNSKITAKYYGLTFIVFFNDNNPTKLLITGSLHKYFNQGIHNSNDFHYNDFQSVIYDLKEKFNFNLDSCQIQNLEFGANVIPPIKSRIFLKGLLSHKNEPFNRGSIPNADYYEAMHRNYYIKIYDKAKQFRNILPIQGEILRVELKYIKMNDLIILLTKKGLLKRKHIALDDLINVDVWIVLGELLLNKWNEILFYDYTINDKELTNHNKTKLWKWKSLNFWEGLTKQKKLRQKCLLSKIVKNHSDQLQLQVANLISLKLDSLIQKGVPFNQYNSLITGGIIAMNGNGKGLPINSILNQLNGNLKQTVLSTEKAGVDIPNYSKWINDERELPF